MTVHTIALTCGDGCGPGDGCATRDLGDLETAAFAGAGLQRLAG